MLRNKKIDCLAQKKKKLNAATIIAAVAIILNRNEIICNYLENSDLNCTRKVNY